MNEEIAELASYYDQAVELLQTKGVDFAINIVTAILIFYVGKWISGMLTRGLKRIMDKHDVDPTLTSFVSNLVRMALMVFVVIAAITQLGVPSAQFVAVVGAAGLAVGLALQGSLANFAAGVLIVLFRPYKVGDFVEAAGVAGTIEQVQILTTILKTPDNKQIVVPNGQIMGSIITNYSAKETRRVDMVVGVSYSDDLDQVAATLKELVDADERILKDPECTIAVSELADSSVNFVVRPWVKSADYWGVKFDLTEAIKKRFDADGISIPFPQQDVYLHQVSS
jgi:small conductance mechanosensitive channel